MLFFYAVFILNECIIRFVHCTWHIKPRAETKTIRVTKCRIYETLISFGITKTMLVGLMKIEYCLSRLYGSFVVLQMILLLYLDSQ